MGFTFIARLLLVLLYAEITVNQQLITSESVQFPRLSGYYNQYTYTGDFQCPSGTYINDVFIGNVGEKIMRLKFKCSDGTTSIMFGDDSTGYHWTLSYPGFQSFYACADNDPDFWLWGLTGFDTQSRQIGTLGKMSGCDEDVNLKCGVDSVGMPKLITGVRVVSNDGEVHVLTNGVTTRGYVGISRLGITCSSLQCPFNFMTDPVTRACTECVCSSGSFLVYCNPVKTGVAINDKTCQGCRYCSSGKYEDPTIPCTLTHDRWCLGCPQGKYSSGAHNTECLSCPAGTYASSIGMSACSPCSTCAIGYMPSPACSLTADTVCVPCGSIIPYSTNTAAGQVECNLCVDDYFRVGPSCVSCAQQTNCLAGLYGVCRTAQNKNPECVTCQGYAVGAYCPIGQEPNRVCDGKGMTNSACTSCPAGKEKTTNSVLWCTPCNTGYYKSANGTGNCVPCTKAPMSSGGALYTAWLISDSRTTDSCPWYVFSICDVWVLLI